MSMNLVQKIMLAHNVDMSGQFLAIHPDQVLVHDATGTPVFLQLEAMGVNKVKPFTIVYVDHNTLQVGYANPDDHRYLKQMAAKIGAYFSRPGNGICHQVHLENFAKPGVVLLGSDSHTPTAGALASLAFGAGGLDVATALAGEPYYMSAPKIVGVRLSGALPQWTSAKDVILHLLRTASVKGGVGRIFEYFGAGVGSLSVYDRATICNMGAETGATTSLFPTDERTLYFLRRFGREKDFENWAADEDADYDEVIEIDLDKLEPLVAMPDSPDNVRAVSEVEGIPVHQVCIGSCTNSSYKDLGVAARVLAGNTVHPETVLAISPGSRRTLVAINESGDLDSLLKSGARLLECSCGPCNGIGQSPESGANTLRTHNRNFKGRCGTMDAKAYLCSAETAAISAINGSLTDPRKYGPMPQVLPPDRVEDFPGLFIKPAKDPNSIKVIKGPNIKPIPLGHPPAENFEAMVGIKVGDDITTDDILPGGAKMLALCSNVPDSVPYLFERVDTDFAKKMKNFTPSWVVVGGENYGQGSSREHAVMVPLQAGMKLVIVKSFARIHRQNLINFGIVPLLFEDKADYELIKDGDELCINDFVNQLKSGKVIVEDKTQAQSFTTATQFSEREFKLVLEGGLLNYLRSKIH